MVNVLGGDDPDLYPRLVHVMAADPGLRVHLYGKLVRPGRKVGHVTALGDDIETLRDRAGRAASYLSLGTEPDDSADAAGGRDGLARLGAVGRG
jgi:5-(carboxyamino)imidazole ribonucleotide synthase